MDYNKIKFSINKVFRYYTSNSLCRKYDYVENKVIN